METNIKKEKGGLLIELKGIWDMPAAEEFIKTFVATMKNNNNVTVDLDKVEYICVSGLRQLLHMQYLAATKHSKLKIINVDERTYKKLCELNYIERMDITTKTEEQS